MPDYREVLQKMTGKCVKGHGGLASANARETAALSGVRLYHVYVHGRREVLLRWQGGVIR